MNHQPTPQPSVLPPISSNGPIDTVTLELLANWRQEDANASPEELAGAEEDLRQFKQAMNENRASAGESTLFP